MVYEEGSLGEDEGRALTERIRASNAARVKATGGARASPPRISTPDEEEVELDWRDYSRANAWAAGAMDAATRKFVESTPGFQRLRQSGYVTDWGAGLGEGGGLPA